MFHARNNGSALVFFAFFTILSFGCSTPSSHQESQNRFAFAAPPPPTQMRSIAAEAELTWVPHLCGGQANVPFRKYTEFALDAVAGKLYGRGSATSPSVEIKQKPKSGGAWTSVDIFFDEAGIKSACAGAPAGSVNTAGKAPVKPHGHNSAPQSDIERQRSGAAFTPPLDNPAHLYYAALDSYHTGLPGQHVEMNFQDKLSILVGSDHVQKLGEADILVESCEKVKAALQPGQVCITGPHRNYEDARRKLFGDLDLRETSPGNYEVFDAYCQTWLSKADFEKAGVNTSFPGPDQIPHVRMMNCEHTWPQSKFTAAKDTPENMDEKSDLHHMYSTDSKLNGLRGNYDFGEVNQQAPTAKRGLCAGQPSEAILGPVVPADGITPSNQPVFEPPKAHKGNVARALFYFAIRWRTKMSPTQEYYLRRWHKEDPPDAAELKRNERIYQLSGARNPFIDHPEYMDQVGSVSR